MAKRDNWWTWSAEGKQWWSKARTIPINKSRLHRHIQSRPQCLTLAWIAHGCSGLYHLVAPYRVSIAGHSICHCQRLHSNVQHFRSAGTADTASSCDVANLACVHFSFKRTKKNLLISLVPPAFSSTSEFTSYASPQLQSDLHLARFIYFICVSSAVWN